MNVVKVFVSRLYISKDQHPLYEPSEAELRIKENILIGAKNGEAKIQMKPVMTINVEAEDPRRIVPPFIIELDIPVNAVIECLRQLPNIHETFFTTEAFNKLPSGTKRDAIDQMTELVKSTYGWIADHFRK